MVMRQHGASFLAIVVGGLLSIAATVGYSADAEHWSYSGPAGPAKWGNLEKGFAQCKLGQTQSPIDIPDQKARKGDLAPLLFNYKPSPLKRVANWHSTHVNSSPGTFLNCDAKPYDIFQFSFHK